MVKRYAIVRDDGLVLNVILLNESADWPLPKGQYLVLAEGEAERGGTLYQGRFYRKPYEPKSPTLEERVAALEKAQGRIPIVSGLVDSVRGILHI